jgi:hypothetical protein
MTITGSEKQASSSSLSPSASVPARKRTPTACKTWKEKLRLACLDRARRRRRHDHDRDSFLNDGNDYEGDEMDGDILPPARALLEEELRQQGITVISPCINMDSRFEQQQQQLQQQQMMNTDSCSSPSRDVSNNDRVTDDNNNEIHANHYISEEELFELLQEVEEEMQRGEEEMHQLLANERELELEQQVQEFEQQKEAAFAESSSWNTVKPLAPRAVLCPICKEANLSETMQGGIVCPNHIVGSCPFELRGGHAQRQHGLTLTRLCQQLRRAYEQHAKYCHDFLSFEVATTAATNNDMMIYTEQQQQQQPGQVKNNSLVAVCPACETRMQLV